jgi:tetratricopeptide (TPR) repeat protein
VCRVSHRAVTRMSSPAYQIAHLGDLHRPDGWAPIRRELDVRSFGINAWTGQAGQRLIPPHDEGPTGHEELYLVTAGHASFSVGSQEVDAPDGTIVFVRDPAVTRGASAIADGTTVLSIGAEPGAVYEPQSWETNRDVMQLFEAGRVDEARLLLEQALSHYRETSTLHYNLACAEALLGKADSALEHLRAAVQARPSFAEHARADADLAELRDDPRFHQIVG